MGFSISNFFFDALTQTFVRFWEVFVFVFLNGGWVVFALFILWVMFYLNWDKRVDTFVDTMEWVYLNIAIPEMPSQSIMAAEQMFAQLHATQESFNWREKYILAREAPWFSFEIVSLGGVIHFMVRTVKDNVDIVKSAIFAQYPDAEIKESGDYMEAFKTQFNPEEADYDFWGTDLELEQKDAYPIKTYTLFEHRAAETIIDPLASLLETMANIEQDEVIAVQIVAQASDDDWKESAKKEVEKLRGTPPKTTAAAEEYVPPSMLMHRTDKEKEVIVAIQNKLAKLAYTTKVRFIYIAPKDKMKVGMRIPTILGAFGQYTALDENGFKPNKFSRTKLDPTFSEKYEGASLAQRVLWKKRWFINNFKKRELNKGGVTYHLSTEELASLFHFPLEDVRKTSIEKIDARKGEPPVNLPI